MINEVGDLAAERRQLGAQRFEGQFGHVGSGHAAGDAAPEMQAGCDARTLDQGGAEDQQSLMTSPAGIGLR